MKSAVVLMAFACAQARNHFAREKFNEVLNSVQETIAQTQTVFNEQVVPAFDEFVDAKEKLGTTIEEQLSQIDFSDVKTLNDIKSQLSEVQWDEIHEKVKDLDVTSVIDWENVDAARDDLINGIKSVDWDSINTQIENVRTAVRDVDLASASDKIKEELQDFKNENAGKHEIDWKGISDCINETANSIDETVNAVDDLIKEALNNMNGARESEPAVETAIAVVEEQSTQTYTEPAVEASDDDNFLQ